MDGEAFAAYIGDALIPELKPGTVVIRDNLATHRNAEATTAMRAVKCWFLHLIPIKQVFAKLEAHQRKIGAHNFSDLFKALGDVCCMSSLEECWT